MVVGLQSCLRCDAICDGAKNAICDGAKNAMMRYAMITISAIGNSLSLSFGSFPHICDAMDIASLFCDSACERGKALDSLYAI